MLKQRLSLFLRAMPLLVLSASAVAAGEARASEQDKVHARSIKNTRHNLSRSGRKVGNTVVADGTSRICIFCHTPHQSKPTAPLWNRESAGVTYKLYGSSTLRGVPQQPKGMSRLCLSCHDGTVAIGAVRRRPRGEPNEKAFSSGGALKRLAGMPTSLGTDLSDDHPIMVDYDEAARYNDEIVPRGALPGELHLSRDSTVHCTTCHSPHNSEHPPFLVADNSESRLCVTCHSMKGWKDSAHATSAARWRGRGKSPLHLATKGGAKATVAANGCESCHKPHGASNAEWLLKDGEEGLCLTCHNGSCAAKDISKEFNTSYGHLVGRYDGVHDAYENVDPQGRTIDGRNNDNRMRHAECADCHSPHSSGKGTHRAGVNEVSSSLKGVSGVKLTYGAGSWKAPSFRWVPSAPGASYEYEICMKCHSTWSWESLPPGTTDGTTQTDPSVEFNPNNASYHAVVGNSRASAAGDYVAPWNSRSRMYCSDCHRGDRATSSAGAHGSRVRFLLAGNYDETTGRLGTQDHLCFKCHRFTSYADPKSDDGWRNTGFSSQGRKNLHAVHAGKTRSDTNRTVACVGCHASRPHGVEKKKALIVTQNDQPPYRHRRAGITSIDAWAVSQGWDNDKTVNCSTVAGCHGP